MIYKTKKELMQALSVAAKGKERAAILADDNNRNLILNSGASLFMITGSLKTGHNFKEQFADIKIGVIERLNPRTGNRDGIGGLGGLSERTSEAEFEAMSPAERNKKIGKQDDIIAGVDGEAVLTKDINIIRVNNVAREMEEELDNIGIKNFYINLKKIEQVPLDGVRDDNYVVNIWDGQTNIDNIYAINPYLHKLHVEENFLDSIVERAKNPQKGSEVQAFIKLPLFEALGKFGKFGGKVTANEDNRDLTHDFRYPHEYLVTWNEASALLNHNPEKMVELVREVQNSVDHEVNFKFVAQKTGQDLSFLDKVLNLPQGTVEIMQQTAENTFKQKEETKLWIQKTQKKVR